MLNYKTNRKIYFRKNIEYDPYCLLLNILYNFLFTTFPQTGLFCHSDLKIANYILFW